MDITILDWLQKAVKQYQNKTIYTVPEGDTEKGESLSFQDVDIISRRVATGILRQLKKDGKPFASLPIAILCGRHVYTPPCFLGVARAGCFYAPMSEDLPESRLLQSLSVANPEYIITDHANYQTTKSLIAKAQENGLTNSVSILILESLMNESPDDSLLETVQRTITEDTPLYMIFTSGSTGVPKGVLTSHHAMMCYLDGLNEVVDLNSTDILGNQSPLDYIAAIRDIYLPLLTGCSTIIIPAENHAMPEQLFGMLEANHVTSLFWSASELEILAKLGALNNKGIALPSHIKRIVFSGSVIAGKYLKMWKDAFPDTVFINQYGPTEATASCTYYTVSGAVDEDTVLPIGQPYKNYKVFLMSESMNAADDIGEICVSGPALALGYYRNKQQTDQVFVINPITTGYEERIYLTGDLGKYNENGELMFLGRKDRQVKHLGHRIELSEIEIAAMRIPGVTGAVAVYQKEASLLYLFYTGDSSQKDIVTYFRQNMPSYMVPRRIMQLDSFPLLPNGKTDMNEIRNKMKS